MARNGTGKDILEGLNSRAIAELKSLNTPSPEVGDVLEAVLLIISSQNGLVIPTPTPSAYTWEEARKALSDSRRFLRALEKVIPEEVPESIRSQLEGFLHRDHSNIHPTAVSLAHWVNQICAVPKVKAEPQFMKPSIVNSLRRVAVLEAGCIVSGPCTELPIVRLTPNSVTVLKRSSRLWTAWQADPTQNVFTFDVCMWAAQRRLDAPIASIEDVYQKTLHPLVETVLSGVSACICLIGSASKDFILTKDASGRYVHLEEACIGLGLDEVGIEVGAVQVCIDGLDDLLTGNEIDFPEERWTTKIATTITDVAEVILTPCNATRVIILQRRLDPKTRLYIVEYDMTDTTGMSALRNWGVAVKGGASRLATHPVQRLACDAFGLHGRVMLLCTVHTSASSEETIRGLGYTQLSKEEERPEVEVEEVDPLTQARADLAALRKTELSQFRAVVPSPPIQAAAEAALLCLGANPGTGWDGCRSAMCDPNLMRRIRTHESIVHLPEADLRRLKAMLRRCNALPLGVQNDHKDVVACGIALAQWASAVFAMGLVRTRAPKEKKKERDVATPAASVVEPPETLEEQEEQELPPPNLNGSSKGVVEGSLPGGTPTEVEPIQPAFEGGEGGEEAEEEEEDEYLAALKGQVAFLEAALGDQERQLALLRHRDERLRLEQQNVHVSPPPVMSGRGNTTITGTEAKELTKQGRAPRKEKVAVTAQQSSQLRLSAWKDFVRAARRELSEQELLKVSYDTLKKLLLLYRFDANPPRACRVELYWKEANWAGDGPFIPEPSTEIPKKRSTTTRKNPATHSPRTARPTTPRGASRSPATRSPAARSPGTTRSPAAPRRAVKDQPLPQTPETIGNKKRGTVGHSSGGGRGGAAPLPSPKAPAPYNAPYNATSDITAIGERERPVLKRQKGAPIGYADPNRMMDENDRFRGVSPEGQARVRQKEMYNVGPTGEILPCGTKAALGNPNECVTPPTRHLVKYGAQDAASSNPNATLTQPSTVTTSKTTAMRPLPAAPANPNETSAAGHTAVWVFCN